MPETKRRARALQLSRKRQEAQREAIMRAFEPSSKPVPASAASALPAASARFRLDIYHHGREHAETRDLIECAGLDDAERQAMVILGKEIADERVRHCSATIVIRDDGDRVVAIASMNAMVRRL